MTCLFRPLLFLVRQEQKTTAPPNALGAEAGQVSTARLRSGIHSFRCSHVERTHLGCNVPEVARVSRNIRASPKRSPLDSLTAGCDRLSACVDKTGPRNLIEIRLKQLAASILPGSAECCPRGRSNGGLTPNAGTCARLGARPSRCRARHDDPDPSLVAVVVPLNITIVSSWQARWKRSWSRYSPPRLRSVR